METQFTESIKEGVGLGLEMTWMENKCPSGIVKLLLFSTEKQDYRERKEAEIWTSGPVYICKVSETAAPEVLIYDRVCTSTRMPEMECDDTVWLESSKGWLFRKAGREAEALGSIYTSS